MTAACERSEAYEFVAAYLDELASQRRQSPHTVSNYRRDLLALCELSAALPVPSDLRVLETPTLRLFIAQLHARGLGGRSLARRLSAWRGFYDWLVRRGEIMHNPALSIRAPKSIKALPKVLSPDEANRLLDVREASEAEDTVLLARDSAMFELFYSSGLRLAELVALNIAAVGDLAESEMRVLGKRNKPRVVPVGSKAILAIKHWLTQRPAWAKPEQMALFVGLRGGRISPRIVEERLKLCALAQGLPVSVYPHMLRHSVASHLLQASGDLRATQELLGHASIASTQIYTHLNFEHLSLVYDAAHPRAKRKLSPT